MIAFEKKNDCGSLILTLVSSGPLSSIEPVTVGLGLNKAAGWDPWCSGLSGGPARPLLQKEASTL